MTMRTVVVNIKTLACVDTDPKERLQGEEMAGMPTIDNAYLLMEQGRITAYGRMDEWAAAGMHADV